MKCTNVLFRIKCWTAVLCAGGTAYQLAGCNQNVSDILTTGFADASVSLFTAIITAFFTGLNQPDGNVSVTTLLDIAKEIPTFLC